MAENPQRTEKGDEDSQTSDLGSFLIALWINHGTKILIVLTGAVLLFAVITLRQSTERAARETAAAQLADAQIRLEAFQSLQLAMAEPVAYAAFRDEFAATVPVVLDQIIATEPSEALTARALVMKGDVLWTLALSPRLAEATTRPALDLREDRAELLSRAEQAYQETIERFETQSTPVAMAKLGLAALAENRREWDAARTLYQQVADMQNIATSYQWLAGSRAALLAELQRPVRLASPTTLPITADQVEKTLDSIVEPGSTPTPPAGVSGDRPAGPTPPAGDAPVTRPTETTPPGENQPAPAR